MLACFWLAGRPSPRPSSAYPCPSPGFVPQLVGGGRVFGAAWRRPACAQARRASPLARRARLWLAGLAAIFGGVLATGLAFRAAARVLRITARAPCPLPAWLGVPLRRGSARGVSLSRCGFPRRRADRGQIAVRNRRADLGRIEGRSKARIEGPVRELWSWRRLRCGAPALAGAAARSREPVSPRGGPTRCPARVARHDTREVHGGDCKCRLVQRRRARARRGGPGKITSRRAAGHVAPLAPPRRRVSDVRNRPPEVSRLHSRDQKKAHPARGLATARLSTTRRRGSISEAGRAWRQRGVPCARASPPRLFFLRAGCTSGSTTS